MQLLRCIEMKISLRNVKINKQLSEETNCFSATICLDDKKVGVVSNRGCGGSDDVLWDDPVKGQEIEAYAKSLPSVEHYGVKLDYNFELLVGDLLEKHEMQKQCNRKTLFVLKDTPVGSYHSMNVKFTEQIGRELRKEYGDKLISILNEEDNGH